MSDNTGHVLRGSHNRGLWVCEKIIIKMDMTFAYMYIVVQSAETRTAPMRPETTSEAGYRNQTRRSPPKEKSFFLPLHLILLSLS